MDDLGAGHNGLATFIKLDPDIVKLDILLARGVEAEPRKQRLIRSMGGICAELEVDVITEGVETASQREMLAGLGCDLQQGYLFGRPERRFEPPRFADVDR
jgi:EAL domain-containing protein (putative c-di-GMP-specific phosphodiesterase class I)